MENRLRNYILLKKYNNGELFFRIHFSPDQKIVWPLLAESGFRMKHKDIPTCRIHIDGNSSSPVGYMGYDAEYFGTDEVFNKAAMAFEKNLKKGETLDPSKLPDPIPVSQTKTQVIFKKIPIINRPIHDGEFDLLIPKGGEYTIYPGIKAKEEIISVTDNDYVIHPE